MKSLKYIIGITAPIVLGCSGAMNNPTPGIPGVTEPTEEVSEPASPVDNYNRISGDLFSFSGPKTVKVGEEYSLSLWGVCGGGWDNEPRCSIDGIPRFSKPSVTENGSPIKVNSMMISDGPTPGSYFTTDIVHDQPGTYTYVLDVSGSKSGVGKVSQLSTLEVIVE